MSSEAGDAARSLQVRRIALNLSGVFAINLLSLVTGPILARALGPAARGVLAAALLWPALVGTLLGLGVPDAVTYFTSLGQISPHEVTKSSGRLALIQAAAICLLGLPVVYLAMHHFGSSAAVSAMIYLAVMPVQVYIRNLLAVLNGLHRYAWFNALQLQMFAINAVALTVLWAVGTLTVRTAVLASAGTILLTLIASVVVTRRIVPRPPQRSSPGLTRKLLGFGTRSQLSAFPHLLNDRVDQLVLSLVVPSRDFGLYVVAVTIATASAYVGSAVAISVLPTIASLRSPPEQVEAARRSVVLTAALTFASSIFLLIVTRPVIVVFFGRRFLGALPSARVLVFAAVMISLARVFHSLLKGIGRPMDAAISEGSALFVTGVGLALLLPTLGIMGAAITSLLAYSTSVAIGAALAGRALEVSPIEFVWRLQ